jgi:anti-sigma B factor antagonist
MHMTTTTRQIGGVTIVDIGGRIVLGEEGGALRELVCDLLSSGHNKILLNLGDVNYIDSSGLGHLVSALTRVRKQGKRPKLAVLTVDYVKGASSNLEAAFHGRSSAMRLTGWSAMRVSTWRK